MLLAGASNTTWSGGALPFSLAGLGAPGCDLLVDPRIPVGIVLNGSGNGSLNVSVPNIKALVGQMAYAQFYVIDSGANALNVAVSAGAALTIGG